MGSNAARRLPIAITGEDFVKNRDSLIIRLCRYLIPQRLNNGLRAGAVGPLPTAGWLLHVRLVRRFADLKDFIKCHDLVLLPQMVVDFRAEPIECDQRNADGPENSDDNCAKQVEPAVPWVLRVSGLG
jgi:hypothetical protein